MSDRLAALRELLEDDPDDAFTRYGLAMELASLGRTEEAVVELRGLTERAPDYLATYYQLARALQRLGRVADALDVARRGVAAAGLQADEHTEGELEDLVAELE